MKYLLSTTLIAVGAATFAMPRCRASNRLTAALHGRGRVGFVPPIFVNGFVTSGLGISTNPPAARTGTSRRPRRRMAELHDVYVNPSAYRAFMSSGSGPDKTIFIWNQGVEQRGFDQ